MIALSPEPPDDPSRRGSWACWSAAASSCPTSATVLVRKSPTRLRVQQRSQIDPVDELESHVRNAVDLAEVDDAHDVAVTKLRGETRFAFEKVSKILPVAEERQHDLETNPLGEPARPRTNGLEGLGHPAHAETPDDFVGSEVFAAIGRMRGLSGPAVVIDIAICGPRSTRSERTVWCILQRNRRVE